MYRYFAIFMPLILCMQVSVFSQKAHNYDYYKEIIGGANFNTNGGIIGGAMFKLSWHRDKNRYHSLGIEVGNVKHPKEVRLTSFSTGSSFIAWKQHYLFPLRFNYGRDFILFNRAPEEGVQINGTLAAGPTIGFLKPYYILFGTNANNAQNVAFDPDLHSSTSNVHGAGSFLSGFDEMTIVPGINMKASLTFYFTKMGRNVTGLETGFMLEAYTQEIVIIPFSRNRQVFSSAFINIFFGARSDN